MHYKFASSYFHGVNRKTSPVNNRHTSPFLLHSTTDYIDYIGVGVTLLYPTLTECLYKKRSHSYFTYYYIYNADERTTMVPTRLLQLITQYQQLRNYFKYPHKVVES